MTRGKLSIRVYWTASINTGRWGDFSLTVVLEQNHQARKVNCATNGKRNHLEFGMDWRVVFNPYPANVENMVSS